MILQTMNYRSKLFFKSRFITHPPQNQQKHDFSSFFERKTDRKKNVRMSVFFSLVNPVQKKNPTKNPFKPFLLLKKLGIGPRFPKSDQNYGLEPPPLFEIDIGFMKKNSIFFIRKSCLEKKSEQSRFFTRCRFFFLQNNKNNVLSLNRLVFHQKTTF